MEGKNLRDNVSFIDGNKFKMFYIPHSNEDVHSAFSGISDAIRYLDQFSIKTNEREFYDSCTRFLRRIKRPFKIPFNEKTLDNREDYALPIIKDIMGDLRWDESNKLPSKTFEITKTTESLIICYRDGFNSTDEIINVNLYEEDELKGTIIRNCGKGIKYEHAPYNPSFYNKWRYDTPSKISFSIGQRGNSLQFGLCNNPPKEPLWYKPYKYVSLTGKPYSKATLDIKKQTKTVKQLCEK